MKKIVGATLLLLGVVAATFVSFSAIGGTNRSLAQTPQETLPDFKVAFIGDQGINLDAKSVLNLILTEGADMVMHQGDFGYGSESDPARAIAWDAQITAILGDDFPYFGSIGNHDVANWPFYQQLLQDRLDKVSGASCTGELGVMAACTYGGLFFILSGAGTMGGTETQHTDFIKDQLAADDSVWSVCSWHKNQNAMQVGSKSDSVGWGPYEACRVGGAILATGQEHSYSRTKTLIDTENQTVDPNLPDRFVAKVGNGSSFVFVSGLAGQSIRDQNRCFPIAYPYGCNWEWAQIYTSNQSAKAGALFIEFNVGGDPRAATGYFKNISGTAVETFSVTAPGVIQTITGNVQDASGPITGASVSTDNGQTATTDAAGIYLLDHVLTGDRTVIVNAAGYSPQQQPATISEGGSAVLDFLFGPPAGLGSVKGKVRESGTGDRIRQALVEVVGTSLSTTTNNGATYSFSGDVPVGNRTIRASKTGYITQETTVAVLVGQTVSFNFDLQPESGGNVAPTADNQSVLTPENTQAEVLLSGSDSETCELLFTVVLSPTHGVLGPITGNICASGTPNSDSGSITYTPNAGYSGADSFAYQANDGIDASNTATVSITVGTPNSDIYVWDIEFESRTRGKNGVKHDERLAVTIRRDSDNSGTGDISDDVVAGATVTVELLDPSGGTVAIYTGNTTNSGVFRTGYASNLSAGTYVAEVTALTHVSYTWSQDLDPTTNDSDFDGDNFPDQDHSISH